MKTIAPAAILLAALASLWTTPPNAPILGLSHDEFFRGALTVSVLAWLTLTGMAHAGAYRATQVLTSAAFWAASVLTLYVVYVYRYEFSDVANRFMGQIEPPAALIGRGGEVVIRRRFGGEFLVPGRVNDARTIFVFDTGATSVVLTAEDAAAAGVSARPDEYVVRVATANGSATAAAVRLDRLAIGDILARGVPALVARPGALRQSLLGMSYLERLGSYTVAGGRLILKGR